MGKNSGIEWTDHTANFWWGCMKVSQGCANCYAEGLSNRFGKDIWGPPKTTDREYKKGIWDKLPRWNRQAVESGKRQRVFVQSMSDFFEDHPQVTEWRQRAIELIQRCTALDFQVLTKRPDNVMSMVPENWKTEWPAHVWIGTSIENQETADKRIPELLTIPARLRFLSIEPLLGPIDLRAVHYDVDWVIVGGESGPNARPMHPDWVRSIRDQCQVASVPFFFKQWGAWGPMLYSGHNRRTSFWPDGGVSKFVGKKKAGRELDGREWNQMPVSPVKGGGMNGGGDDG